MFECVKGEREGQNHMVSGKQKPVSGEKKRGIWGRRMHRRRGEGEGFWAGFLKLLGHTPNPLPVVVVADGVQSLPYCHSPLRGQITSEHCLAGQVQKPLTPLPLLLTPHHLLMAVYVRTW